MKQLSHFLPLRVQKKTLLLAGISLAWLAVAIIGTLWMASYSGRPGETGSPPLQWPGSSAVTRNASQPALVMFVHPHCPCSRASVGELALLMAHCQGRVTADVFFLQPAGEAAGWVETDTWRDAAAIPGVTVHRDLDGQEARLFGSETSGDTRLYDEHGLLTFHGGITVARGHAGDNPGRSALQALLFGQTPLHVKTPVFGCSLFECKAPTGT